MAKYRKRPVIIDAFQFGVDRHPDWFDEAVRKDIVLLHKNMYGNVLRASIRTLEGIMTIQVGDYVIKGVQGEIYPCKADIFEQTYEAVT